MRPSRFDHLAQLRQTTAAAAKFYQLARLVRLSASGQIFIINPHVKAEVLQFQIIEIVVQHPMQFLLFLRIKAGWFDG